MNVAKSGKQPGGTHPGNCCNGLSNSVRLAMENYFADLDGHNTSNLYDLFIRQVEMPMFEVILRQSRGNMTKASRMLGMNRATLRSRLKKYGLD